MRTLTIRYAASAFLCLSAALLPAQVPVYLNIGSHNETEDFNSGLDYIGDANDYEAVKQLVLQIYDTVKVHDARWNLQVESNFIRGCIRHDTAYTNPNDLLQWINGTEWVEVDPHNHFNPSGFGPTYNPYNYSDLAFLLTDSVGLSPRTNLGGFIYKDFPSFSVSEDWTQYQDSVPGNRFPFTKWRPHVIWGGGSPGHTQDFNASGIWKPTGPTTAQFGVHNPSNFLTCIGSNCGNDFVIADTSDADNVIRHAEEFIYHANHSGLSTADTFYTLTVMINFKHIQSAGYVEKVSAFIRAMDAYVQQGQVIWSTLTEKYDTWYVSHGSGDSFTELCTEMHLGAPEEDLSDRVLIYPNPTADEVVISVPGEVETIQLQVMDLQGKTILAQNLAAANNTLSTASWAPGIYMLRLTSGTSSGIHRLVVAH